MSSLATFSYSALVTSFTTLSLGIFVYLNRKKSEVHQTFALYTIAIAFWSFCVYKHGSANTIDEAELWGHMLHIGSISIPLLFYRFVLIYFGYEGVVKRIILYLACTLWLFFQSINFTDLFVPGVRLAPPLRYLVIAGPVYHFFVMYFVMLTLYSIYLIYKSYITSEGIRRRQLRFFLMSSIFGYIGGVDNFIIMYDIKIFPLFPYGTYAIAIYVFVATFIIFRYRFLDIEVIIKRTLVFAGIVAAASCAISFPIGLIQLIVGKTIGVSPFWLLTSGIVTTALIYRPLERRLVDLTDRFLFQKKYDYRKLLKDAAAGISQIKSLNQLLSLVVHFITMRLRTRNASMLLHDEKNNYFKSAFTRGYPVEGWLKSGHVFNEQDPLIDYLEHERQPIDIERVKEYIETGGPKTKKGSFVKQYDYKLIKVKMDELLAACCVPSFLGKRLLGVLVLGEKKSGDAYSDEDLAVLFTIAQESAIAIENARLYDDAIEKAKELEIINDNLNAAQTNLLRALRDTEVANKKLQETTAALISAEKKATMVGMAQAIGHEVYNPLVPISGKAQHIYIIHVKKFNDLLNKYRNAMAEDDIKIFEKAIKGTDDYAHSIVKNVDRVQAVVQSLTGTLKESTGQMDILNLAVYCERMLQTLRFTTGEENISGCEIELDIAENLFIRGNSDQLDEVFLNLIKNAFQAMGQKQDRCIVIHGRLDSKNPEMVRIDVTDNGPGIPPEIFPKIWQHGFSTKKRKDDSIGAAGQGHGLFVCKHLIEGFHRGTITVTSTVGKGTTFIITLPLAEQKE